MIEDAARFHDMRLRSGGEDEMMREIEILRAALHAAVRERIFSIPLPSHVYSEGTAVDHYVSAARRGYP